MKKAFQITNIFFLWLSGILLVAHGIIPHHHHFESSPTNNTCQQECHHSYTTSNNDTECHHRNGIENTASENKQHHCQACSFNTKTTLTLSNISIECLAFPTDIHFLLHPPANANTHNPVYINHYLSFTEEKTPLRGPPLLG